MCPQPETRTAPRPYSGFEGQYIDGDWRAGRKGTSLKDTDPYSGETLTEIALANAGDLDEAYQSAAKAQVAWAQARPGARQYCAAPRTSWRPVEKRS